MIRLWAALALVVSACAPHLPRTTQGIRIEFRDDSLRESIDVADIDYQVEIMERVFYERFDLTAPKIAGVWKSGRFTVRIFPEAIPCPSRDNPDKTCPGLLADTRTMAIYNWRECQARNAYTHELTHIMALHLFGDADLGHANPELFGFESASRVGQLRAVKAICPELFNVIWPDVDECG